MSYLCKLTGRVSDLNHKGERLKGVRRHLLITDRVIGVKIRVETEDEEGQATTRVRDHSRKEIEREDSIHPEVWAEFADGRRKLLPNQRLEPVPPPTIDTVALRRREKKITK